MSGPVLAHATIAEATTKMRSAFKATLAEELMAVRTRAGDEVDVMCAHAYAAGLRDGWNQGLDHAARTTASTRKQKADG